jgi:hypothetical protein
MHSYYTEIPQRSFDAIVKNGYLIEVLVALLVDPLEAEDVSDSIESRTSTAIKLEVNDRVFSAPIELADFQNLPSKDAFEKLKITLSQWAMTTDGANDALRELTMWDRRFGVWCACAVAREALRFVPKGEERPLLAIETTEAWVLGRAALEDVRRAANDAYAADAAYVSVYAYAYASAASAAANAAFAAVRAVGHETYATTAAFAAARAAAYNAYISAAARPTEADELLRLTWVAANACLTFPG